MRRQAFKIPSSQDVCIWCATRMRIASARASAQTQRKYFRSTPVAQRPPSGAVAQTVDEDYTPLPARWRGEATTKRFAGGSSNSIPASARDDSRLSDARTGYQAQGTRYRKHILAPDKNSVHEPAFGQDGRTASSTPRQQQPRGSGWARNSGTGDLTPEEQKLRDALRKTAATSSVPLPRHFSEKIPRSEVVVQKHPQNLDRVAQTNGVIHRKIAQSEDSPIPTASRYPYKTPKLDSIIRKQRSGGRNDEAVSANSEQANWDCSECGFLNYGAKTNCRQCRSSRPVPAEKRQASWMCTSCEQSNAEQYGQCWNCRSERGIRKQKDEASLSRGWEHVRRIRSDYVEPPAPPATPVQTEPPTPPARPMQIEHPKDLQDLARARQIEREKTTRLEETKDGRFVGFGAHQRDRANYYSNTSGEPLSHRFVGDDSESTSRVDDARRHQPFRGEQRQSQYETQPQTDRRSVSQRKSQYEVPRGANVFENTSMPPYKDGRSTRRNKKVYTGYDQAEEDDEERAVRKIERREQRKKIKTAQKAAAPPTPIYLPEFISVSNLAAVLKVRVEDFVSKIQKLGFEEISNDHILDAEVAGLVATEFNYDPIVERTEGRDLRALLPAEDKSLLPARPPVVTIMGHVDHGKTTLLDYLRKSSVAASEHGGITQHIGAFSVPMPGGRIITFLDTPGHEAFLSMRKRGANVTDIVILVVAADDSVKPQTIEAIKHAQAAKVPMIVAVNKIDKEESNIERVKQDLSRYSVEIEDYGGDTQVVCVSGKTGQGMQELEDAVVALADILDMRAEVDGHAEGWVLEATTKKAGRVATVLVRRGTLRPGNVIVAGTSWARVRSLRNEAGVMVGSAGPGTPIEIDGWREQPIAGDEVIQAPDEQKAKNVVQYRLEAHERVKMATDMEAVNETRRVEQEKREQLERAAELAKLAADNPDAPMTPQPSYTSTTPASQEVFFVIKGDVSGSVEAVTDSVSSLGNTEVRPNILRAGVGPITEFDVDHAAVAKGHIINFNTAIDGNIRQLADEMDVEIIDQSIIYKLVDDVRAKLSEKLPPIVTQKVLGEAEIAKVFEINTTGRVTLPVAGCRIRNGVISRTAKIRVLRDVKRDKPDVVYNGTLSSLKNVKKDVTEMRKGTECGMGFEKWTDFKVGDQIQAYEEIVQKRTL